MCEIVIALRKSKKARMVKVNKNEKKSVIDFIHITRIYPKSFHFLTFDKYYILCSGAHISWHELFLDKSLKFSQKNIEKLKN